MPPRLNTLSLIALADIPLIAPGDDLAAIILQSLTASGERLEAGDVLVLAQKIVSKAEGRTVDLNTVTPSEHARTLAAVVEKDARLVELVLSESQEVLRARPGVIIVVHRLGFVLANAGIDHSNVGPESNEQVLLLPRDPDQSCAALRGTLKLRTGVDVAVMIIDSIGRAWRNGTVGTAIGISGFPGLLDLRGRMDMYRRPLRTSELGIGDEVASAASLLMGQADEGRPVVIVRGLSDMGRESGAGELVRARALDLFR